jgi:acetyl-CoA carboxylase, biotin carboxylase subunit
MIEIAGGAHLPFQQADVTLQGHAIECRINAEDPANGFRPSPRTIATLVIPEGANIRFDTGMYAGYSIPPFYNSLVGKLIVGGKTRLEALDRVKSDLKNAAVSGIATTIPLHLALVDAHAIRDLAFDTTWL